MPSFTDPNRAVTNVNVKAQTQVNATDVSGPLLAALPGRELLEIYNVGPDVPEIVYGAGPAVYGLGRPIPVGGSYSPEGPLSDQAIQVITDALGSADLRITEG